MADTYTYSVTLDLSEHPIQSITVKQYSKNVNKLEISVTQKGVVYIIDSSKYNAYFKMRTPDNRYIYDTCEVDENGLVTYTLPENSTWVAGTGEAEVEVISNDGKTRMSTCTFEIVIDASAYPEGEITASNDYSALVNAMAQVGEMEQLEVIKAEVAADKQAVAIDKETTIEAKNAAVESVASAESLLTDVNTKLDEILYTSTYTSNININANTESFGMRTIAIPELFNPVSVVIDQIIINQSADHPNEHGAKVQAHIGGWQISGSQLLVTTNVYNGYDWDITNGSMQLVVFYQKKART